MKPPSSGALAFGRGGTARFSNSPHPRSPACVEWRRPARCATMRFGLGGLGVEPLEVVEVSVCGLIAESSSIVAKSGLGAGRISSDPGGDRLAQPTSMHWILYTVNCHRSAHEAVDHHSGRTFACNSRAAAQVSTERRSGAVDFEGLARLSHCENYPTGVVEIWCGSDKGHQPGI